MSDTTAAAALFKPKPSRIETKADATTTAARAIIDAETAAREAKTEKLRAARLAAEQGATDPETNADRASPAPSKKAVATKSRKPKAAAPKKVR